MTDVMDDLKARGAPAARAVLKMEAALNMTLATFRQDHPLAPAYGRITVTIDRPRAVVLETTAERRDMFNDMAKPDLVAAAMDLSEIVPQSALPLRISFRPGYLKNGQGERHVVSDVMMSGQVRQNDWRDLAFRPKGDRLSLVFGIDAMIDSILGPSQIPGSTFGIFMKGISVARIVAPNMETAILKIFLRNGGAPAVAAMTSGAGVDDIARQYGMETMHLAEIAITPVSDNLAGILAIAGRSLKPAPELDMP